MLIFISQTRNGVNYKISKTLKAVCDTEKIEKNSCQEY